MLELLSDTLPQQAGTQKRLRVLAPRSPRPLLALGFAANQQLWHLMAMCPWARLLTSLHFPFLIGKIRIVLITSSLAFLNIKSWNARKE